MKQIEQYILLYKNISENSSCIQFAKRNIFVYVNAHYVSCFNQKKGKQFLFYTFMSITRLSFT